MALSVSKMRKNLKRAKKVAGNAATMWTKLRYHYGWHFKHTPVDEHAILFESFHGKTMSDSPLFMLREFVADARSDGFTVYYATTIKNLKEHRALATSLGIGVEFVAIESWKYVKVLATAKYLVNNSSFPAYFTRRPEQRYIQTWHGTPLKTLGKSMRLGIESMYNVQHNFLQANVVTFPNEFTRDVMMRDYNLEKLFTGEVALLGYPRNTVFFDTAKAEEVKERCGLADMETFAYMPTWRGANNYTVDVQNYRDEVMGFLHAIDEVLDDGQAMFVNFHSMVASQIKLDVFNHVFPFPADEDNYEFLNAMDVLVTDYSSVFFDYSITRKPIVMFIYDKEAYLSERGMYLDIETLPFPKARTIDELTEMIRSGSYRTVSYEDTDYEREFLSYDSPENARKALDLLFGRDAAGVPTEDYSSNSIREWRIIEPRTQATVYDVRTACEAADPESDIVLFAKSRFNEDKSLLLHDEYRDDFEFVFATKAYTCTAVEEILGKRTQRGRSVLSAREKQRVFPNLNVSEPVQDVYVGAEGTSCVWDMTQLKPVKVRVKRSEEGIELNFGAEKIAELGARGLSAVQKRVVIWHRDLTREEIESGLVRESFESLRAAGKLAYESAANMVLDCVDGEALRMVPRPIFPSNRIDSYPDDRISGFIKVFFYRNEVKGSSDVLVAYKASTGNLTIRHELRKNFLAGLKFGMVESVRSKGGAAHISMTLRDGQFVVEDVVLKLRSKVDPIEISLPYTLRRDAGQLHIEATLDPNAYQLQEIYWEVFVAIRFHRTRALIPVKFPSLQRRMLYLRNQQWPLENGKVLFTHIAKGGWLSFVYRDYYPELDTYLFRLKEFAALGAYVALLPYWKRKRIWLVFEKFCKLAQDNGYYFFDYCMSLPEQDKQHIFYVMDKSQPDYKNVRDYGDHVIDFMSFKNILYLLAADIYVGSDSKSHLYVWRPKPSVVRRLVSRRDILFLQHGVTAMKRVDPLFGVHGSSPMTYFLATSDREQQIVVDHFGYNLNCAPVLGFSRWDVLEDKSRADNPSILLMPTWRPWLEEQGDELFVKSEYFEKYSLLIQSVALAEVLERHNARLRFFIHPKLSERLGNFQPASERIELVPQGSEPLNQVMMECNMLITDYSSVCWDMLYMDKPIVFYQFDQELYEKTVGSYVDLARDLPGDVCLAEDEAIAAIDACAARGFTLTEEQAAKAGEWFAHKDTSNRRRTYNFLVEKGY